MEDTEAKQAVKIYKALGEPTRLKVALILSKEGESCCSQLGTRLESVADSTLSHHLKQLADSGLLDSHKEGTFIYYRLNHEVARKYAPFLLD